MLAALHALPRDSSSGSHQNQKPDLADDEDIGNGAGQEFAFRRVLYRHGKVVDDVGRDEHYGAEYPHLRAYKQKRCGDRVEYCEAGPIGGAWPSHPAIVPKEPVIEQNARMVCGSDKQARCPNASNEEAGTLHRLILRHAGLRSKA